MKDEYENKECTGCGVTTAQLIENELCTRKQIEEYAVITNSGMWYCHEDCFRDSRG